MTTRLTAEAHRLIAETADWLRDSWETFESLDDPREATEFWESERDDILRQRDFCWTSTGSARIVCGISRTLDGQFATTDGTPVVVKFEPWIADGSWDEGKYDNHHELTTWRLAVERGDDGLFAPVHARGPNGRWLVMTECLPVFPGGPSSADDGHGGDYLVDTRFSDEAYIDPFKEKLDARGWYEHDFKHGNVGVHPNGNTVLVDYGSFTRPSEP